MYDDARCRKAALQNQNQRDARRLQKGSAYPDGIYGVDQIVEPVRMRKRLGKDMNKEQLISALVDIMGRDGVVDAPD